MADSTDKRVVIAITPMSEELFRDTWKFFRRTKASYKIAIFESVFVIILSLYMLIYYPLNWLFTLLYIAFPILWILYFFLYRFFFNPLKRYRKNIDQFDTPEEITFREDDFQVINKNKIAGGQFNYSYDAVPMAYESQRYFFVYVPLNIVYTVSKTCFITGSPEELRSILVNKLGGKFKLLKYGSL